MDTKEEKQSKVCRICLDDDDSRQFIAPCKCTGSSKYVHRDCLDHWRATKHNAEAFTTCSTCKFIYRVRVIKEEKSQQDLLVYYAKIGRDVVAVALALHLLLVCLSFILSRACFYLSLSLFEYVYSPLPPESSALPRAIFWDSYIFVVLLSFLVLGVIGIYLWLNNRLPFELPNWGNNMPRFGFFVGGLVPMLQIASVIIMIAGAVVGIGFAVMFSKQVAKKHMNKRWLQDETKRFHIIDLDGKELAW